MKLLKKSIQRLAIAIAVEGATTLLTVRKVTVTSVEGWW